MIKKILLVILFCLLVNYSYAETIKAGIVYDVNTARTVAFDNVSMKIDMNFYQSFFVDLDCEKNLKAIANGKLNLRDRILTIFDDGEYGVYNKKDKTSFFYSRDGKLLAIMKSINTPPPLKYAKYDIEGNLISLSLSVSSDESYIFDINKKLQAHWIGKNCYNEQGELIMTRE